LEEAGDAIAAVLAALERFLATRAEAGMIAELQRLLEDGWEVAAVVNSADGGLVRNGGAPDEVAAAQLHPVDAADSRCLVDDAVEHVVGLGRAGAAVRSEGHRVGEHAAHVHRDVRDVVHAGEAAREVVGLDMRAERAEITAYPREMADAQRDEFAVGVERKLR